MKKLLTCLFLTVVCTNLSFAQSLTSFVDPFIGTDGFGHTFPGATTPFGMVQLSPDTRTKGWENCSGYHSSNPTIIGFSHTHLSGTGAADYGDIMFMATSGIQLLAGDEKNHATGYRSAFSKSTEVASPGYYRVILEDYNIEAEMTATTRCGMQKYTFAEDNNAAIILDLVHGIEDKTIGSEMIITGNNTVEGYRRSSGWAKDHYVFFYAEFSKPFNNFGIADHNGKMLDEKTARSAHGLKGYFTFKTQNRESVLVKVGISTVSAENAKLNLKKEIPGWDFNAVRNAASAQWEKELSRIKVEGENKENKVKFYTALYHTMIHPNVMSDVDGRYRGMDGKIHKMEKGNMYTVFSLWDTFRALHPLFTIIDPDRAEEFVRSLLQKYRESGLLPVWELASNETFCMIGYHSVPVIADAFMKGLRNYDVELAYEAAKSSAMRDHLGLKFYKEHGYIPADKENEPVSKTLEYAYDDWCIAQMAKELGKQDDYLYFSTRARYYMNVYDMQSNFMRARKNASWFSPFDPYEVSGLYTEANAWQYTFFVPHDIKGMASLMGGVSGMTTRLDSLFGTSAKLTGRSQPDISGMIGQYAHGNEPSHHFAYLYNYTPKSYKTAELVKKVMNEFYTTKRDGLIGNEDCGQMSAWFVFSSMGIYPVCPGNNEYETGSPLFRKITISRKSGKNLVITADSLSENSIYVAAQSLDGMPIKRPLTHKELMTGNRLDFRMTSSPASPYITDPGSTAHPGKVMMPFITYTSPAFFDSSKIEMNCFTGNAQIRYTTDGYEPSATSALYTKPFYINNSTQIKIKAFHDGKEPSFVETANFIRLPYKKKVTYTYPYSYLYTAGGENGLVDGLYGQPNVFGGWQGFFGDDLDVTIDLGEKRKVSVIEASFLQQYPAWIWLPSEVIFSVSDDGVNYRQLSSVKNTIPLNKPDSFTEKFKAETATISTRYVKVTARNIGKCPDWHPGAGEKAWIFADEIRIE